MPNGVSPNGKCFMARSYDSKKKVQKYLGTFDTKEEASAAYMAYITSLIPSNMKETNMPTNQNSNWKP